MRIDPRLSEVSAQSFLCLVTFAAGRVVSHSMIWLNRKARPWVQPKRCCHLDALNPKKRIGFHFCFTNTAGHSTPILTDQSHLNRLRSGRQLMAFGTAEK